MKRKFRWKELPLNERLALRCKQKGISSEMCEYIKHLGEDDNDKRTRTASNR